MEPKRKRHDECDVVIIGAGVAGLSAAGVLKREGCEVHILEATERIGGRIWTVHDPLSPMAIELGAEFVHGRPRQTWELIGSGGLMAYEHTGSALHMDRGRVVEEKEAGEIGDQMVAKMGKSARRKDESFHDYLGRSHQPKEVKSWARIHIEGFNAAREELISAASLTQDADAAEKIEGDRAFRIVGGYDAVPLRLLRSIPDYRSILKLQSIVERVRWRRGSVEVQYRSALSGEASTLRCRQLIVTVPLGVLQAKPGSRGAIAFDPQPAATLEAARSLQFGQVYRVTFRFRETFWEENERLKRIGFVISREKRFFTWWTMHPIISPLLTGWMAGSAAEEFRTSDRSQIIGEARESLARILGRKVPQPEAAYFHDWRVDPFFRGAYSYVPVGALAARKVLAKAVSGTLFFAGEATDLDGHGSTVHGAIASGIRAAKQVQAARAR